MSISSCLLCFCVSSLGIASSFPFILSEGQGTITISLTSYLSRFLSELKKIEFATSCFALAGPGQVPSSHIPLGMTSGSNLFFPFPSISSYELNTVT